MALFLHWEGLKRAFVLGAYSKRRNVSIDHAAIKNGERAVCKHRVRDARGRWLSMKEALTLLETHSYNTRHISWDSTDIFCLLNVGFFELAS